MAATSGLSEKTRPDDRFAQRVGARQTRGAHHRGSHTGRRTEDVARGEEGRGDEHAEGDVERIEDGRHLR